MKTIKILILLSICTFIRYSVSAQIKLKEKHLLKDFLIFESSLKHNHPQLYLYTPKEQIDAFLINAKAKLKGDLSTIEFYRILSPILPLIGNNHTNISPPKAYINYLSSEANRFPFSLFYQNDSLYVLEDASTEYTIREGSRITSINDIETSTLLQTFLANISTDGFNETQPVYRASRGFSRYLAYFYGSPESYKINYIDSTGNVSSTIIDAIKTKEIIKNRSIRQELNLNNKKDYSFEIIKSVGLLTIRSFSISSHGSFKRFLQQTFKEISAKGIDKLLIDLRDNLGGFPEASNELLSYLVTETIHPYRLEYAITNKIHNEEYFEEDAYTKHFNRQKLIKQEDKYLVKGAVDTKVVPKKYAFDDNLYIMMNANSSSTTGQLIGLLKSYTNALFIGEEPGGNPVGVVANDILTLILPHSKIEVKLPVIYSEVNVNFENTGHGIIPDVSIKPTISDLLSGKDKMLEQSLGWIMSNE